ncbi:MAG: thiamine diphosphokinase [Acidobacteriota bacterium]
MKVALLANGPLGDPAAARAAVAGADLVVAADGGARHAVALGMDLDVVVGDLDSLAPGDVAALEARGVAVHRHPADKDETDLELALRLALARGARQAIVVGGLGARWDQSLATVLLAADPAFADLDLRLVEGGQEIRVLHGGRSMTLDEAPGTTVSLLPLAGPAEGVVTEGLHWPLRDEPLRFGSPRGVSNRVVARPARVGLARGVLAVVVLRGEVA